MKKRLIKILVFLVVLLLLDWGIAAFIHEGLCRYYGVGEKSDILMIGHSHMMKSCDKLAIEKELNVKVSKYCREGVMVRDRHAMVKHYLESREDKTVPWVLYSVDPCMFQDGGVSLNSYKLFYPFMDVAAMDDFVRSEATTWYDYPLHKYVRTSRFTDNMIYRSARGWAGYWKSFQNGSISDKRWSAPINWRVNMPEHNVKLFRDTLDYMLNHGCRVVLVHLPIIASWRNSNPEGFEYMMNYFRDLANSDERIYFLEYNTLSDNRDIFSDSVHVNHLGEKLITAALIQDLKSILGK